MRCDRLIFAAVLVLAIAGVAQASPIADPQIIIGGPFDAILLTPGHLSVLPPLVFNTDARCTAGTTTLNNTTVPDMTCGIINDTNSRLLALTFNFSTPQMLTLLITSNTPGLGTWTSNCINNNNCTSATFTFTIPLPDSELVGTRFQFVNFAAGLPIGVSGTVPEPATLTLLACGMGILLARRRRTAIG